MKRELGVPPALLPNASCADGPAIRSLAPP